MSCAGCRPARSYADTCRRAAARPTTCGVATPERRQPVRARSGTVAPRVARAPRRTSRAPSPVAREPSRMTSAPRRKRSHRRLLAITAIGLMLAFVLAIVGVGAIATDTLGAGQPVRPGRRQGRPVPRRAGPGPRGARHGPRQRAARGHRGPRSRTSPRSRSRRPSSAPGARRSRPSPSRPPTRPRRPRPRASR